MLGLINKKEEIIDEITRKEKNLFLLNQLKRVNLNTYFYGIN